ncbi:MAG: prepilin-type N-terminal cleavage/methylation domain [Chthoniobacteraceae bacterium]|nr:prepilin-type N-terminal cleavage/methylation domain [Chthoniobacteraceae bacterium]
MQETLLSEWHKRCLKDENRQPFMRTAIYLNRRAFTLVEIMVVVAIIAMLASISIPNYLRMRKRSQASRILSDLQKVDSAIDLYAIENKKGEGTVVTWSDIRNYIKTDSVLYVSGGVDLLGHPFEGFTVDSPPLLSTASFDSLSDVAPLEFWSPYR